MKSLASLLWVCVVAVSGPGAPALRAAGGTSAARARAASTAKDPAPRAGGTLVVRLPAGEFSLWLEYQDEKGVQQTTPPVQASGGRAALDLTPLGTRFSNAVLVAHETATGNMGARKLSLVPGGTSETVLSASDINAVAVLRVRVLGADGQPAAGGSVTLTGKDGVRRTRPLVPERDGTVEFERVPFGRAKVRVLFADGKELTQDLEVQSDHPPGAVTFELAAAGAPAGTVSRPGGRADEPPDAGGTEARGAAKEGAPANAPAGAPSGTGGLSTLAGLILLGALCYVGYRTLRDRGVTVEGVMRKLGVQLPAADTPSAASAKPAPPPPVVPEGRCAFCGEPKDPVTGACACSLGPAAAAPPPLPSASSQARLIVVQGPALGASFALGGEVVTLGRAADCTIALSQDAAVSRRHATIRRQGSSYVLRDEGSSNGTFVNGMRVAERVLAAGDEIQVGQSRLRFEA